MKLTKRIKMRQRPAPDTSYVFYIHPDNYADLAGLSQADTKTRDHLYKGMLVNFESAYSVTPPAPPPPDPSAG